MAITLFERNFKEATAKLLTVGGQASTTFEVSRMFFGGATEFPKHLTSYESVHGKKNAIVLIGLSCTGKSTYAKEFIKDYPDFEYLSLDDCAFRELEKTNVIFCLGNDILKNTLGFREFGEKLEKGKNLIIDGGWVHINSRSALLTTLKQLGYNTCACVFDNITEQEYLRNVEARVISQLAYKLLEKKPPYTNQDWVAKYQEEKKMSREEAITTIRSNEKYNASMLEGINMLLNEREESDYNMQTECGLLVIGFDTMIFV